MKMLAFYYGYSFSYEQKTKHSEKQLAGTPKLKGVTMKKQILSFSPLQTAKVFALLYFIMSIPLIGFMSVSFALSPAPTPGMGFLVALPFLYLIFGFVFTAIGALIYNFIAKWVGGIEYTSATIENA